MVTIRVCYLSVCTCHDSFVFFFYSFGRMQLHILTIIHLFTTSIFLEIKVHVTSISWTLLHVWCFPYYSFTVWLFLIFFSPIDSSNLDLQLFSLLHIKCLCLKGETWVAFLTVMYFLLCPPHKRKTIRQLLNLQLQKFAFIMVYLSREISNGLL